MISGVGVSFFFVTFNESKSDCGGSQSSFLILNLSPHHVRIINFHVRRPQSDGDVLLLGMFLFLPRSSERLQVA